MAETLVTEFTYDGVGNRLTVTDPRGVTQRTTFDRLNRPERVEVEDGGGWKTLSATTHDAAGNVLTTTDLQNNTTHYTIDGLYRVVGEELPAVQFGSAPAAAHRTHV